MSINTEVRPADAEGIARAAELLRQGELVALPTETVYGIAADARNGEAVSKIFVAKGRPQDNPLIVHVTGPEMLHGLVSEVPERAQLLMAAFCPGPLTIIMPRGPEVAAECWVSNISSIKILVLKLTDFTGLQTLRRHSSPSVLTVLIPILYSSLISQ